jgi:class 3 adenylate cyclase
VKNFLAAVLAADLVGYTHAHEWGRDEHDTAVPALREGVLDSLIAEHRGRVVKPMGDGLLVVFASVVDAVTCAR